MLVAILDFVLIKLILSLTVITKINKAISHQDRFVSKNVYQIRLVLSFHSSTAEP